MTQELKPCPFCGKMGAVRERTRIGWANEIVTAFIPSCKNGSCILFNVSKEYKTEDGAKRAWNRRIYDGSTT